MSPRSLVLFAILATSSISAAQSASEAPPPPPPSTPAVVVIAPRPRVGFELGAGLWGGSMSCTSQNGSCMGFAGAGGLNVQARWFFNPGWGLFWDAWGMVHGEDNSTITQVISTVGVQWRPFSFLTLAAGIGGAHANYQWAGIVVADAGNGVAGMASVAVDLIRSRKVALSIEARGGTAAYDSGVTGHSEALGLQLTLFGL